METKWIINNGVNTVFLMIDGKQIALLPHEKVLIPAHGVVKTHNSVDNLVVEEYKCGKGV